MYLNRMLRHVSASGGSGTIGDMWFASPISDADPVDGIVSGSDAWPWAAVNTTGGDLVIDSGLGQHRFNGLLNVKRVQQLPQQSTLTPQLRRS
jgi:hypothetical protein